MPTREQATRKSKDVKHSQTLPSQTELRAIAAFRFLLKPYAEGKQGRQNSATRTVLDDTANRDPRCIVRLITWTMPANTIDESTVRVYAQTTGANSPRSGAQSSHTGFCQHVTTTISRTGHASHKLYTQSMSRACLTWQAHAVLRVVRVVCSGSAPPHGGFQSRVENLEGGGGADIRRERRGR